MALFMIFPLVMVERTMKFKGAILPIKSAKDIQQDQRKPEELTIKELRHQIQKRIRLFIRMPIN